MEIVLQFIYLDMSYIGKFRESESYFLNSK